VELSSVINTGRFSFERASQSAGWLDVLSHGHAHVSSCMGQSGGMGSFVYTARRPFHPARLHALLARHFTLQEPDWGFARADAGAKAAAAHLARASAAVHAAAAALARCGASPQAAAARGAVAAAADAAAAASAATAAARSAAAPAPDADDVAAKAAARGAAFGQILRSKGFAWVAGALRTEHCAEWSSAGGLMRLGTGGPWFAGLPRESWPHEADKVAAIEADFAPGIGDRWERGAGAGGT